MSEKLEAIVVGAGPAGSTCAYQLAKAGVRVLLVERGTHPGAKNMFGGRIYTFPLQKLYPGFEHEAPIERFVTKETISFLSDKCAFSVSFEASRGNGSLPMSFTALRSRFDKWLAQKAEEAGADVITGIKVDQLLLEDSKVRGILAGGDHLEADVVVVAEGATCSLTKQAGLRRDLEPYEVSIGMKEVIELPPETIEARFNLGPGEGAAAVYVGAVTKYLRGGGFLYTNRNSLSLGVVANPEDVVEAKTYSHDLIEHFKTHPTVRKLIEGGKVVEYSAHLIPEMGYGMMPELYRDGVVVCGDAAGFLINEGYTFRGVDMAMASGAAAAAAIVRAKQRRDFSRTSLSFYERALEEWHVLQDLKRFRNVPKYLKNRRLYREYPKLLCAMLERMYHIDGSGQHRAASIALKTARTQVSMFKLVKDLLGAGRTF